MIFLAEVLEFIGNFLLAGVLELIVMSSGGKSFLGWDAGAFSDFVEMLSREFIFAWVGCWSLERNHFS